MSFQGMAGKTEEKNYVYVLRCADGTLYTGWTNDLEKRIKTHNEGKGAKYTRSRRPVELVYCECFETRREALRREGEVKRLRRTEKERLFEAAPKNMEETVSVLPGE